MPIDPDGKFTGEIKKVDALNEEDVYVASTYFNSLENPIMKNLALVSAIAAGVALTAPAKAADIEINLGTYTADGGVTPGNYTAEQQVSVDPYGDQGLLAPGVPATVVSGSPAIGGVYTNYYAFGNPSETIAYDLEVSNKATFNGTAYAFFSGPGRSGPCSS